MSDTPEWFGRNTAAVLDGVGEVDPRRRDHQVLHHATRVRLVLVLRADECKDGRRKDAEDGACDLPAGK
jgi:hypothetical protein